MSLTIGSLASLVEGTISGHCPDLDRPITNLADLKSAGPGDVSFLANPKYAASFRTTRAGAVLVAQPIDAAPCPLIVVRDPYLAMARVGQRLFPARRPPPGVAPGAHVDKNARIHESASIGPSAVVEAGAVIGRGCVVGPTCYVGVDAILGEDVLMHPGSKVLDRCIVGDRVILQAGAVIGSDGFGYAPDAQGRRVKIPQVGIVELEADVEIGANTTIDRATFGVTRVGRGSKLDNLVQVAHNVELGRDCVVVSQSGIAGSARLGDRVVAGAQSGIVGHITISNDVMLGARAGVAGSIDSPGVYSGTPAIPHSLWRRVVAAQRYIPDLRRRIRKLEDDTQTT